MLNRKLSNYIFYGSLLAITIIVALARVVLLGNLEDRIASITAQNKSLTAQIDSLELTVQENKNIQTSHLYDLYDKIPDVYSSTLLSYKTVSIMEELGISEADDIQRIVYVTESASLSSNRALQEAVGDYLVVEVEVRFSVNNEDTIRAFIEKLYNEEQLFILKQVVYSMPNGEDSVFVEIGFYAIYDEEKEETS